MNKLFICSLIILSLISFSFEEKETKGILKVEVNNIRGDDGTVGLALYNSKDGFLKVPNAYKVASVTISNQKAVAYFKDVPYGEYALGVLHDMNKNNRMDFNKVGIPKEGFGSSNDAKARFGPPSYEDAKFTLNNSEKVLRIKMKYFEIL